MSFINKRAQFMIRVRSNGHRQGKFPMDGAGVPLRITQYIPMKLKEVDLTKISNKNKESDVVCIPEMMKLFDCYEKHDTNAQLCQNEAQALEKCYATHKSKMREAKAEKSIKSKI